MLFVDHPACLEHDPRAHMPAHPDSPERLVAIESALTDRDWLGATRRLAPPATREQLRLVHTARLLSWIEELCLSGGGAIDADTFVGEASYRAAIHAAGGACELARALLAGEDEVGFAAVRPSGHHAEPDRAMGFCLFDNIAIAAEAAISELGADRVAIIDWDVHHGNGTAAAFRSRDDVLFVSIHQAGLFPGTGASGDFGSGPGEGYTVNLPVPAGSGEELWLSLIEHIVCPIVDSFGPDLILVSAGFDAHRDDPLADCTLRAGSFGQMSCHLRDLARRLGIPLGAVLEGGYDPAALADSVVATMAALGGEGEAIWAAPEALLTSRAAAGVARYWTL